ncbi:3-oxoacyl-[acyl-carrier-protein] synthase III C-terminal domain-containing protein [Micromonospora sp. NBRC 101691]|uniref:3-oxoacyl-ACP synthase III family protein n=1 Tax=Micromonospora sp. NBRC 101691 TaxID=3032198 RepID=UPI0024A38F05|nr:3-oxoacyl-[acyl-carrier-protein] synthase III C-terminal domain-containing protein [Micromonospora sp. NBRC 101691]GLY26358.1 3-oxoacyl-ACP synthase [Micromonospora sp. NBRC 101691]
MTVPVSLVEVNSALPENRVATDFYRGADAALDDSVMFKSPKYRRHMGPDETAADLIVKAARPVLDRAKERGDGPVDLLITNVLLPDLPFTGAGAEVAHRLGERPDWVLDVHNGGCVSFVYMLKLARQIMQSGGARTALLCNVQNSAGQVFTQPTIRTKSHAPVPGDGCGVGYLRIGDESPIIDVEIRQYVEYATDVGLAFDDDRKYWQPGQSEMDVSFTDSKVAKIIGRGNQLVPQVVTALCDRIGVRTPDIDVLVTNQPNRMFLRNWREALQLKPERHLDTFDEYGNLFGAAVPITLTEAVRDGRVRPGDLLVLAGFAHAGDMAGAAAVRWQAGG